MLWRIWNEHRDRVVKNEADRKRIDILLELEGKATADFLASVEASRTLSPEAHKMMVDHVTQRSQSFDSIAKDAASMMGQAGLIDSEKKMLRLPRFLLASGIPLGLTLSAVGFYSCATRVQTHLDASTADAAAEQRAKTRLVQLQVQQLEQQLRSAKPVGSAGR